MSGAPITVGTILDETIIPGLTPAEIAQYALVSGDSNPIHTDPALAKNIGLDGVPVQGMFAMALVNNYLECWPQHKMTRKLHVRFVAPALADMDLTIGAKVMVVKQQAGTATLRIMLRQANKLVAMGEAEVVLVGA